MKLVMVSNYSKNNKHLVDLTLFNHYEYCTNHNIDFLFTQTVYSPYNDLEEIENLWQRYDAVATVGTDILFTDMNKSLESFISDSLITFQEESFERGYGNGDFIIWRKIQNQKEAEFFDFLKQVNKSHWSSQETLKVLRHDQKYAEFFTLLPPKSIQSICPFQPKELYGNNFEKLSQNVKNASWTPGDFSVHCFTPGHAQHPNSKYEQVKIFLSKFTNQG